MPSTESGGGHARLASVTRLMVFLGIWPWLNRPSARRLSDVMSKSQAQKNRRRRVEKAMLRKLRRCLGKLLFFTVPLNHIEIESASVTSLRKQIDSEQDTYITLVYHEKQRRPNKKEATI